MAKKSHLVLSARYHRLTTSSTKTTSMIKLLDYKLFHGQNQGDHTNTTVAVT
jgi:hypothetical protein